MVSINKKLSPFQAVYGLIPAIFSVGFLVSRSVLLLLVCVVSLFIVVGTVPAFKKRENLWMFILVAANGLPINIWGVCWIISEGFIDAGFLLGNILWGLLLCCMLMSVEEIVLGVITRIIWKRQYRLNL